MEKILLTGFEAYGHTPYNPAESVARELSSKVIRDSEIIARIVPKNFFECIDVVWEAITEIEPNIVVMMGEYGGRATISIERIAKNLNDSTRYGLSDNKGCYLQGQLTVPDGPAAYYSTLPLRAMVKAMRESGIPSDISDAPGTFCCNHLMYGILHRLHLNHLLIRAGWIHLPHLPCVAALPENLGAPSMSVETSAMGVEIGLRAVLENLEDINEPILSRLQI
ncbi:pyroglutamyl-peptidase I [Thioflavicoccus mobilis 8321]|uniref:Pyroglutamyl-peptidase I n=1 Tax=Thioflavicoccus mobilis 8321 TaxID=765912 RepID=L0H3H8_9GAMM|nr:pyroglutamyl-peptidase I [Thioflavicoccus mobilis]AGA92225.1 pyroglutamyl-peptidase I [Thioflavicoccus mobilis 8321]